MLKPQGQKLINVKGNAQSRPIILNRRSLSSSSIPRKRTKVELPYTSRDEYYAMQHSHIMGSYHQGRNIPLMSHDALFKGEVLNSIVAGTGVQEFKVPIAPTSQHTPFIQFNNNPHVQDPCLFLHQGPSSDVAGGSQLIMMNSQSQSHHNLTETSSYAYYLGNVYVLLANVVIHHLTSQCYRE